MKAKMVLIGIVIAVGIGIAQEHGRHEPMTFESNCRGGDCVLLTGAPQTSGMRGGSVKLKPGESVGWHSTLENEEALVIRHGTGVREDQWAGRCTAERRDDGIHSSGYAA